MIDQRDVEAKLRALTDPPKRRISYFYTRLALIGAAIVASPFAAYWLDTRAFPVVSDAKALVFQDSAPGETLVAVIYYKNRACRIVGADFYLNGAAIKPVAVLDPVDLITRPLGKNRSRTFRLAVPRDVFIDHGMIQFTHQCHPFWLHQKLVFG